LAADLQWSIDDIRSVTVWNGRDTLSLDSPDGSLETTVARLAYQNQSIDQFDESVELNEMSTLLRSSLMNLDESLRTIISLRFGLSDDREHTRHEIASTLAIPASRVRFLEQVALTHLRGMWEVSKGLKSYW
jgi:DNA-directed RNA polymerase sigma subunit (sigma70/sigma32)